MYIEKEIRKEESFECFPKDIQYKTSHNMNSIYNDVKCLLTDKVYNNECCGLIFDSIKSCKNVALISQEQHKKFLNYMEHFEEKMLNFDLNHMMQHELQNDTIILECRHDHYGRMTFNIRCNDVSSVEETCISVNIMRVVILFYFNCININAWFSGKKELGLMGDPVLNILILPSVKDKNCRFLLFGSWAIRDDEKDEVCVFENPVLSIYGIEENPGLIICGLSYNELKDKCSCFLNKSLFPFFLINNSDVSSDMYVVDCERQYFTNHTTTD